MKHRTAIKTDEFSAHLRSRSINLASRRILISKLRGTGQEVDLSEPANCAGVGRIRHFRRQTNPGWPSNWLPIDPACDALNLPRTDVLRAQAFQNAACNWRCWYCYVPFELLAAKAAHACWLSCSELVDLYLDQAEPPAVIDLTGGQPDLVPEWIPWLMSELRLRGLEDRIYLWSDDNLSTDYLWRFVGDNDLALMESYHNYGRICCFKGFDVESFAFNTRADPKLFDRQFVLMRRLLDLGPDIYAYATFTSQPRPKGVIQKEMARFVDRLQELDEKLPLRTVPLEIQLWSPVRQRVGESMQGALDTQIGAVEAWNNEIDRRFGASTSDESDSKRRARGA